MSIVYIDSFSHYATADIYKKWTTPNNETFNFDRATIVSGAGRCGQSALKVTEASDTTVGAGPVLVVPAATEFCAGVGFKALSGIQGGGRCIFRFSSGGVPGSFRQVEAVAQTDMTIELGTGSASGSFGGNITTSFGRSTQVIQSDSWHFIELVGTINGGSGTLQLWVDDVKWLDLTGLDTDRVGSGSWNVFQLGAVYGTMIANGGIEFSDVYLGTSTADRKGDSRVYMRLPNADGTYTEWTPSTGTAHYANVDDNPPDADTTYNESQTSGQRDTYLFPQVGIASGTVYAVQLVPMIEKTYPGARTAATVIREGGTDYIGTSKSIAEDQYLYYPQIYDANSPSGASWTTLLASNDEFGVKVTS